MNFGSRIANWVDDFGYVEIFQDEQKISWTRDSPYNQVTEIDQYYRPFDYFHPSIAKVIKQAHSPRAEVYWISQKKEGFARRKSLIVAGMKWMLYGMTYFLLILLGVITGGFFWPTGFRRFILSYGYKSVETEDGNMDTEVSKSHESKAKQCNTINDTMPEKTSIQTFDECFIDIMKSSAEIAERLDTKVKLQLIAKKLGVDLKHD